MRHGDLKNFSKLKQQKCHKIQKKQSAKEKFAKNKPKNKQPANLQKNRKTTKKAGIHGKTARLATLIVCEVNSVM